MTHLQRFPAHRAMPHPTPDFPFITEQCPTPLPIFHLLQSQASLIIANICCAFSMWQEWFPVLNTYCVISAAAGGGPLTQFSGEGANKGGSVMSQCLKQGIWAWPWRWDPRATVRPGGSGLSWSSIPAQLGDVVGLTFPLQNFAFHLSEVWGGLPVQYVSF